MYRKLSKTIIMVMVLVTFIFPISTSFVFAEGGKAETALTHKIKTDGLSPFNKWWVDMYNNDRLVYALYATGVMAFLGTVIGFGTDGILRLLGFKTTKIIHHE